jgi:hypothetical protein
MQDVPINKTLCKQCRECREFTYQRTLRHGKRKGDVFKFRYCTGNVDILKIGNWGPDTSVRTGKTYATSTKRFNGRSAHFEYFLKKDKKNTILHLGDTLDLRMKMLREVSKRCTAQTIQGKESIFPGVGLTSWYKANPTKSQGKKIWWARVKINGEQEYLDTYYTELEAAHAYYTKMEELGLDINKETEAYNIYARWLNVKEFTDKLLTEIITDYNDRDKVELKWYKDLIKNGLNKKI